MSLDEVPVGVLYTSEIYEFTTDKENIDVKFHPFISNMQNTTGVSLCINYGNSGVWLCFSNRRLSGQTQA